MPPKFFITHSWKDIDFTKRLCDDLSANGLAGFFDAYSIKPGDVVSAEISRGLETCDIYVPILSHASLKSAWCEEEIHAAITLGKLPGRNGRPRIIPVLVEDCQDEMPIFLRSRLYINFAGRYNEALNELLTKGFGASPKLPKPPAVPEQPAAARPESTSPTLPTLTRTRIIWGGVAIGVLVLCVLMAWIVWRPPATPTPTRIAQATAINVLPTGAPVPTTLPTNAAVPTVRPTNVPTLTPVPPTRTPPPIPAPALGIGSTKISADGAPMVYVPAGKFWMGSSDADKQASDDEKPQHEVDLDAFWIDRFEVTNALYKKCVDAGKCTVPKKDTSDTRDSYYGNSQYDNYPVINVTFNNATQYCAFAKKQLPTEAQWEKAARGTDKRIYPWGDMFDSRKLNSYEGGKSDTIAVGSYPNGASPYGAMDMAGNVWEWTTDWYNPNYYKNSPTRNPQNETLETNRVVRGGSWDIDANHIRAAGRNPSNPVSLNDYLGFRCVE